MPDVFPFGTRTWRSGTDRACSLAGMKARCFSEKPWESVGAAGMEKSTTISANFEITMPQELCAKLGWQPGTELAIVPKGSGALLIAVPDVNALHGIMEGTDTSGYRDQEDRY